MKIDCPFRVSATRTEHGERRLRVICGDHNHGPVSQLSALPAHRLWSLDPDIRVEIGRLIMLGHGATQIPEATRKAYPNVVLVIGDVYILQYSMWLEQLKGRTPIQWLLDVGCNIITFPMIY
jgi:hypothetical protein